MRAAGDRAACEAAVTSRWVPVDGRRMHARVAGAGAARVGSLPVVLVHGLSISSRYFVPALRCLGTRLEAIALDLPGFGLSDDPPRVLDVPGMAEAVVAWLDASGIERAVVLGNSVGSQVAVEVGRRYPGRAAGLVLTGLALGGARENRLLHAWNALRDAPKEPLSLWPNQAIDFVAAGPRRVWRTLHYALAYRIGVWLPDVTAPALVVRGEADPFAPGWWVEEVARGLPHGRLASIPGATHAIGMSKPAELAALVAGFVEDVDSTVGKTDTGAG